MSDEITLEQKAQIDTWVKKRDEILGEISSLSTEKEKLEKKNKEIADSSTDIETRMHENRGRIDELIKKEDELPGLIRRDIAALQSTKKNLETEITGLNKVIKELKPQKEYLEASIKFLTETFNSLHERVGVLDKVVGTATEISTKNQKKIDTLVKNIEISLEEIAEKADFTVKEIKDVSRELPKVFLEAQRKSLERQVINPKKS